MTQIIIMTAEEVKRAKRKARKAAIMGNDPSKLNGANSVIHQDRKRKAKSRRSRVNDLREMAEE